MEFEPVIGIEIHVELKTKTKMFSSGPVKSNQKPNSQTTYYDWAFPGTLPTVNKEAVNYGIMLAKALNMDIARTLIFDRKNYFYPDLTKGYQITQQDFPIGSDGYLTIELEDGTYKNIGIERAHLEEDTAKQIHLSSETYENYNRAGTPLIEIVSTPTMHSAYEASKYVEAIHQIITFLDISEGKMEEGNMRCDVNISLREKGTSTFGTKVEVKNINSIANVKDALEYEIKRQTEILLSNNKVEQETRRYVDSKRITQLMRKKTDAVDYKYFREPNILPISLSSKFIEEAISSMKKLPSTYKEEFKQLGLNSYEIGELLLDKNYVYFFTETLEHDVKSPKILWNLLMSEIKNYLNKNEILIQDLDINKEFLASLCNILNENTISFEQSKEVLRRIITDNKDPKETIKELDLVQVNDVSAINEIVNEVCKANTQSINDFIRGKDRALGYIVGQVMKASKGKANPSIAKELVLKFIDNYQK